MGINITIELQPSFYTKINNYVYPQIINRVLEESGEELLGYIMEEAPVRTGALRDGHYLEKGNGFINIRNEMYYWKYVVWLGNDYIDRGILNFINSQIMDERTIESLFDADLL